MTQDPNDVRSTIGAVLAGCLVSVGLSAVVGFQTFLYFQIFPMDSLKYKIMVLWVWVLDAAHTILLCAVIWQYAVVNFGNPDFIFEARPTLVAVHISLHRDFWVQTISSSGQLDSECGHLIDSEWFLWVEDTKDNWALASLISILLFARAGLALISALELILSKTIPNFIVKFDGALTATMSVPLATDTVISLARYYYLNNLQQGYPSTQEMVDVVVVFTINDGCLQCAALIAALICKLHLPNSLIWFGIFCTTPKLYSNSVLATLNLRNWYRHRQRPMGISLTYQRPQTIRDAVNITTGRTSPNNSLQRSKEVGGMSVRSHFALLCSAWLMTTARQTMEVFVDQQIEYSVAVTPGLGDSEPTAVELISLPATVCDKSGDPRAKTTSV
ncbi:hypothetical protein GGX14DRAFT_644679 [Mycena pura]|uniref:DUF6534 domain-containing protein n=1 Tax=Mycena pura TaxID=153505 RepID=A0AAD6V898_9AGAR|nr:hypothetical protein GGX14DRAFT_644679 [Mycena pura]